jgi:U3 small nucleolar RNA-associated protein 12
VLACALLDSTISVVYADSKKFMFSLYAHKLPVTCIDISSDSTLLASVSQDKTVKLWGLDYGDCHKSIIAHEKSILACHFVKETHFFWTAGRDGVLKYWDGDRYLNILKLPGHCGDI